MEFVEQFNFDVDFANFDRQTLWRMGNQDTVPFISLALAAFAERMVSRMGLADNVEYTIPGAVAEYMLGAFELTGGLAAGVLITPTFILEKVALFTSKLLSSKIIVIDLNLSSIGAFSSSDILDRLNVVAMSYSENQPNAAFDDGTKAIFAAAAHDRALKWSETIRAEDMAIAAKVAEEQRLADERAAREKAAKAEQERLAREAQATLKRAEEEAAAAQKEAVRREELEALNKKYTKLLEYVKSGNLNGVAEALATGIDTSAWKNEDEQNLLHIACLTSTSDVVQALLRSGGVNAANVKDSAGKTPVHYCAARDGFEETLWIFWFSGIDVRSVDALGKKPVEYAKSPEARRILSLNNLNMNAVNAGSLSWESRTQYLPCSTSTVAEGETLVIEIAGTEDRRTGYYYIGPSDHAVCAKVGSAVAKIGRCRIDVQNKSGNTRITLSGELMIESDIRTATDRYSELVLSGKCL